MRPLNSKCCVSDICWVERPKKIDVIRIASIRSGAGISSALEPIFSPSPHRAVLL